MATLDDFGYLGNVFILGNRIGNDGLRHINSKHRDHSIYKLSVFSKKISDEGLKALEGLTIQCLAIGSFKVTDAGLKHLAAVKTLWDLDLSANNINGSGLHFLRDRPNEKDVEPLRSLSLNNTTDEMLKSVAELSTLDTLSLGKLKCTDEGMTYLKKLSSLHNLGFSVGSTRGESDAYIDHVMKILPNCNILDTSHWNEHISDDVFAQ